MLSVKPPPILVKSCEQILVTSYSHSIFADKIFRILSLFATHKSLLKRFYSPHIRWPRRCKAEEAPRNRLEDYDDHDDDADEDGDDADVGTAGKDGENYVNNDDYDDAADDNDA